MPNTTAQFYNRIASFYPLINFFLKQHKIALIQEVNSYSKGSLLELGVGHGNYLKAYSHPEIIAIDHSEKMLQRAKADNQLSIKFLKMDAKQLAFEDNQFDYVVASHLLSTDQEPNQILKEAIRVLKPEGKLFILNHFSSHKTLKKLDLFFQPIAQLFHFNSFFLLENLTELNPLKCTKAIKFGMFKNYQLLVFQK